MNKKYISLFVLLSLFFALTGCDRRYTRQKIKDYDIENSEIDQRREANSKKVFKI